jgi:hypothetical protein
MSCEGTGGAYAHGNDALAASVFPRSAPGGLLHPGGRAPARRAAISVAAGPPARAQLGGPLFERLPRSIRLTELGRQFESPRARSCWPRSAPSGSRALRLGPSGASSRSRRCRSIAVGILPSSISRLRRAHPGVSVRLYELGHHALLEERVRGRLADLAVWPHSAAMGRATRPAWLGGVRGGVAAG